MLETYQGKVITQAERVYIQHWIKMTGLPPPSYRGFTPKTDDDLDGLGPPDMPRQSQSITCDGAPSIRDCKNWITQSVSPRERFVKTRTVREPIHHEPGCGIQETDPFWDNVVKMMDDGDII